MYEMSVDAGETQAGRGEADTRMFPGSKRCELKGVIVVVGMYQITTTRRPDRDQQLALSPEDVSIYC